MKKSTMLLLWLGAAISISEIFTGGLLAPLGFGKGLAAILLGHIIGTGLLAFGGLVSFSRKKTAMESVAWSFGSQGGKIIALCNVVQLLGWTIVMIIQGVSAIRGVFPQIPFGFAAPILSILVVIWALILGSPAARLNDAAVALLAALCVVLAIEIIGIPRGILPLVSGEGMSMSLAMELSIAMPVSWLPLVGDYAYQGKDKLCAAGMPFIGYFAGSVLMYLLGLGIGIAGGGDIFTFISASRFRFIACGVVVLSTMTTAFLDLYSAAISSKQVVNSPNRRIPILLMGLFAVLVSVFFPVERYSDFLTRFLTGIGMVFVPVYTLLFLDFLMQKREAISGFQWVNLGIAALGMAGYRLFSQYEQLVPTVMSMILVGALYGLTGMFKKMRKNQKNEKKCSQ